MRIEDQLLVETSRRNTDLIAHYIGNDPKLKREVRLIFEELKDHESAAIKSRLRKLIAAL